MHSKKSEGKWRVRPNWNSTANAKPLQPLNLGFSFFRKLAKSDGQVTDDEIRAFKEKFNVPKSELNKVGKIFKLPRVNEIH